jgi:hypothetical protein
LRSLGVLGPDPQKELFALFEPATLGHQVPSNISYEYLFGPIEDQGQVGTCVTFSTTALAEAILRKRLHPVPPPAMAERALYSLTKHHFETDAIDQEGLYVQDALQVLEQYGYVLEKDFPYTPADAATIIAPVPDSLLHTDHELKGFQRVGGSELSPASLQARMELALFEAGPCVIGISWQNDWFTPDAHGFLSLNPTQGAAGGHEVVVVGKSSTKAAFRVRNSWSADWGDAGYCWLPFACVNYIEDCYTIKL